MFKPNEREKKHPKQNAEDIREVIYLLEYIAKEQDFPSWIEYAQRAREALDEILEGK